LKSNPFFVGPSIFVNLNGIDIHKYYKIQKELGKGKNSYKNRCIWGGKISGKSYNKSIKGNEENKEKQWWIGWTNTLKWSLNVVIYGSSKYTKGVWGLLGFKKLLYCDWIFARWESTGQSNKIRENKWRNYL